MPTELTNPVVKEDITTQKINEVRYNLDRNILQITIINYDQYGNALSTLHKEQDIWTDETRTAFNLPTSVTDPAKSFHQALTTVAKNQGWINPGTTTDDL